MTRLPFLVEYGDLVWKVLAVLAAGAAIALMRRLHAWWERRATARELAARADATTAPVEGVATLRGTLHGGRASSVSLLYLRGRKPYYDERAPELWLDCEGQRVTLVGPVRVVRGTRLVSTRDRRSGLPEGERAVRSSPILHRLTAMTASALDGDAVFVTARLTARPAAEAMGYREAATAWTAAPHGDAIEVVAVQPAVRAVPLGAARTVASGLAGAAAMMLGLWAAGAAALAWTTATERKTGALVQVALGELDAASLAAATPGNREDALALIEARLATRDVRTPETLALWRAIARVRGGCGGEIAARIAQDDIDGLAPLAKHCKDDRAAVDAYQLLGMFHDAVERSKELPPAELPVESAIAVRAYWRAAQWAAAHRDGAQARGDATAGRAAAFDCAAEWWSRLGESDVDSWMARARFAKPDPACAVFAALSLPQADRATGLATLEIPDRRVEHLANALAWAAGAPARLPGVMSSEREIHAAMFEAGDRMTVARALMSEPASTHVGYSAGSQGLVETVEWRAVLAMLRENIGTARTQAHYVAATRPLMESPRFDCIRHGHDQYTPCEHGRALEAAFALRFHTPEPRLTFSDSPRDADALWDRARTEYWGRPAELDACSRPELGDGGQFGTAVLRAAREGDGRDMAALLARCRVRGTHVLEAVFAVWPRIRQGRDELAEVVRRFDLGPTPTDPLAVIGRAALRRDLARMIGDERAADAWAAVADRHMTAFSQPMALTALVTRELLRPAER